MINISSLYVLLGNGFSIDLISRIESKFDDLKGEIDLKNLFSKGGDVPWPKTNHNGFLSYQHCSALWTLGARTTMDSNQSIRVIEDIITCINVYNYSKQNNSDDTEQNYTKIENNSLYIKAYGELTTYLRYLMVHYNSKIDDEKLRSIDVPLINFFKESLDKYDEIFIINYNYDVWLERLLNIHSLDFNIEGFEEKDTKIKIVKPHGSISFSLKAKLNHQFSIRGAEFDSVSQDCSQFDITYNFQEDYPLVNAIIPPAGDSNRTDLGWVSTLREIINNKLKDSESKDRLVIFGLSYWHVDRSEIDEILTRINSLVQTTLINPNPSTTFDAVLTSIFQNYIHYKKSELLVKVG